jgi:putative FmdB family regulatory protein
MPTYGYECSQCGHQLEVLQSISDEPLRVCPECGGALRKQIYPVGVIFKGSGFYTTDYKAGGAGGGNGKAGSPEGSADGKAAGESKPEGKPDSKAESKPDTKSEGKADAKPAGD